MPWTEPREGEETCRGAETDGYEVPRFDYDTNGPEYDRPEPILLPWLGEHDSQAVARQYEEGMSSPPRHPTPPPRPLCHSLPTLVRPTRDA